MDRLLRLYEDWRHESPVEVSKLRAAGSNRAYYRMKGADGTSVIATVGSNTEENSAFLYLSRHFKKQGLPVPTIHAVSDDGQVYIQEDFGSMSLFDAIRSGRENGGCYDERERRLLIKTIRKLPEIQIKGAIALDWGNCYPQSTFDEDTIFFDLNYFKYCFLKPLDVDFNEVRLQADFKLFALDLLNGVTNSFMYRDFQSRNIMLDANGDPCFIDYQGGRKGPYYYDLASFLWQSSAKYSDELRLELAREYYDSLKKYITVEPFDQFFERLRLFVLFRILQVLGAYGFRGYFERKKYFVDSIPPAINNLREILSIGRFSYPYLTEVLKQITNLSRFSAKRRENSKGPLIIRVYSFSYHKGIPEDESGNGGGYVFDCRGSNNPGRYDAYKSLTGLDEPVIRFLEDDGEILTFLESVRKLADVHVQRYIERGFTSLMFSFGCTGGQHRSVYSAQHVGEYLNKKFGVEVRINHREQNITQVLKASR